MTGNTGQSFPNEQTSSKHKQDEHDGQNDGCLKKNDEKVSEAGSKDKKNCRK